MRHVEVIGKASRIVALGIGALATPVVALMVVVVVVGLAMLLRPIGLLLLLAAIPVLAFSRRARRALGMDGHTEEEAEHHGFRVPRGLLLDAVHAWVRRAGGNVAIVGIDDLVQRTIGPVQAVLLPTAGQEVARGAPLFALVREGRRIDVPSPVAGRVRSVNDALTRLPGLVNSSPHDLGWSVEIELADPAVATAGLRRADEAETWFRREVDRLLAAVMPAGPMPALPDGGVISPTFHVLIDERTWERIRAEFFGAAAGAAPANGR